MSTILQPVKAFQSYKEETYTEVKSKSKAASTFWAQAEQTRFAVVPMFLLIVVCIGAICGATVLMESPFKLAIVVVSTSMVQAMIIAVLPIRTIAFAAAIATAVNILVTLL